MVGTSPSGSLIATVSPRAAVPPRPPKGTRWGGHAKGTPDKVNQSIREAIQMAFEQVGGVEYLVRLAWALFSRWTDVGRRKLLKTHSNFEGLRGTRSGFCSDSRCCFGRKNGANAWWK